MSTAPAARPPSPPSSPPNGNAEVYDRLQAKDFRVQRAVTLVVTVVPLLMLGVAAAQLWNEALRWHDLVVLGVTYPLTALGVTVGFHRHLTHRSFETSRAVRGLLAILGSAAIEGSVIKWVADHRRHHTFADEPGDPHSPHVGHGEGMTGALRGLFHAHLGWLFRYDSRGEWNRYARDLARDPAIVLIDRLFPLWVLLGLAFPFALGLLLSGTLTGGLTGLLWGGAVRVFLLHHITYSINSICHFFGRRRFASDDHSGNVWWLALPSLGEAWHNNHHAFPTSAEHGLARRELDVSALVIRLLERLGLAWNVVRPSDVAQRGRAI